MKSVNSNFFEGNEYFIDEKVNFLKFENEYRIYNAEGADIGFVRQKLSPGEKFLRLLFKKKHLPFRLEILNTQNEVQTVISRGWVFWMSKIFVTNADNALVGR